MRRFLHPVRVALDLGKLYERNEAGFVTSGRTDHGFRFLETSERRPPGRPQTHAQVGAHPFDIDELEVQALGQRR